jgi:mannitol/fructose-specific phosphotransferase system IIA component (Ntr-type)
MQSTRRTAALHEIARLLAGHPDVTDFDGFYQDLLARDRLDTTSLGNGIALPHARTEHVRSIVVAVGRSESGVAFDHGNDTVRLIFMLGTPKSKSGDYLQVVSTLCRLLKNAADREALLAAATPEDFIRTAEAIEARLLPPA